MARALLIVDFQNDFTPPDGALAVPDGDAIAARVDRLARSGEYDLVVATRDWHPRDRNLRRPGEPVARAACRASGAELHPALDRALVDVDRQGRGPGHRGLLRLPGHAPRRAPARARRRARDGGRAGDGLLRQEHRAGRAAGGFETAVDSTAVRGVDVEAGDSDRALEELRAAGASVAWRGGR